MEKKEFSFATNQVLEKMKIATICSDMTKSGLTKMKCSCLHFEDS